MKKLGYITNATTQNTAQIDTLTGRHGGRATKTAQTNKPENIAKRTAISAESEVKNTARPMPISVAPSAAKITAETQSNVMVYTFANGSKKTAYPQFRPSLKLLVHT